MACNDMTARRVDDKPQFGHAIIPAIEIYWTVSERIDIDSKVRYRECMIVVG